MSSSLRYIFLTVGCIVLLVSGAWFVAAGCHQLYEAPEAGVWHARVDMLARCDVGETTIIGDSRAGAVYLPSLYSPNARNFGSAGTSPVEEYYFVRRMLKCPKPPRTFIFAVSPSQLIIPPPALWNGAVAYRALDATELEDIADVERRYGWTYNFNTNFGVEPPPALKAWLSLNDFPATEFTSMIHLFSKRRHRLLKSFYGQTQRNGGAFYWDLKDGYGQPCSHQSKRELIATMEAFREDFFNHPFVPNPEVSWYFRRMIDEAAGSGAQVLIAPVPFPHFMRAKIPAEFEFKYVAFLHRIGGGLPNVKLADRYWIFLDDCDFSDGAGHIEKVGAKEFRPIFSTLKFN